jgi:dTDP-4-dehydrorhamnose 3,5-epimerase
VGNLENVKLTPLKIIPNISGNILHAMKVSEESFAGFGEAYFSIAEYGAIKGWKCHTKMLLNIVVPAGEIRFVLFDDRSESPTLGQLQSVILSPDNNYYRLTIPPGIWMSFHGVGKGLNILLNIASIPHDPTEAFTLPLENDKIPFKWK